MKLDGIEWNGMKWIEMGWDGMEIIWDKNTADVGLHVSPDTHTQTETKVTENKF